MNLDVDIPKLNLKVQGGARTYDIMCSSETVPLRGDHAARSSSHAWVPSAVSTLFDPIQDAGPRGSHDEAPRHSKAADVSAVPLDRLDQLG